MTYTSEGYIASITTPEGTVSYTYDDFGRQLSVSDGENNTAYTYDTIGRLSTVTSEAGTTTYSYDVYGNLAKVVTATGSGIITTTYEYDIMNRLTRLTNFSDANNNGVMDEGEGVSQFDYTLDALGKKTHVTETLWFDNNEDGVKDANVNNIGWTYDQQSRLVREVFDHYDDQFDQTLEWTYDEVGNRLTQNLDKGNDSVIDEVTRYYIDANDRLIHELFDGQNDDTFEKTTHYDYDKTQQTAKTVTENGVITNDTEFEYNALGQMSVVTITKYTDGVASSIERTTYGYGSDGIRVSALHEVDSDADGVYDTVTLTEYLNDPNNHTGYSQVLKTTEYSIDGETRTVTKEIYYTIGLDQIAQNVTAYVDGIAQETDHHYFTYDGHGSTRALLDATAAIMQLYSFDAYGNAIGFNPTEALTEYLYSGEQFDSKIGQQYLRARYYDPATGRFNSLDSFFGNLNDPQSLHKYLYTHADPVNGIDPTGMMSIGVAMATSFNLSMQAFGVYGAAQTTYKAFTEGIDALTFWDFMSLIPFGYTGSGKLYSFGIKGIKNLALSFPGFTKVLSKYGGDIACVMNKYRGIVSGNFGTGVHEVFKCTVIGKTLSKIENLTIKSNWVNITLDKQISAKGLGSRPDITIQFPKFRLAIVLDIKPVPQDIFAKGWLPSVVHLYESKDLSIKGRRDGTVDIFDKKGFFTLYLYIPYPSLYVKYAN